MTLLYLAIAYMLGVSLGEWLWEYGLLDCSVPSRAWWLPLGLLLLLPLLHRWERAREMEKAMASHPPLRWPTSAGFVPPRSTLSWALCIGLLLCLSMGVLRYAAQPLTPCWTPTDLAAWNLPSDMAFDRDAAQVTVMGVISNFPTVDNERQEVVIQASFVRQAGQPGGAARTGWYEVTGQVRLLAPARPRYRYGQPVEVLGRMATPPDFEDFSYREVLARQGVHSHFYDAQIVVRDEPMQGAAWRRWLYGVRGRGLALVERMLPEPHASLAEGILLGVDAGIPDALYERFNRTGTSHVLVISGSNVALIAALMLGVSRRLVGRWATWMTTWVALLGIAMYAVLVGAEASVLRAALMGGLVVMAAGVGRRSTAAISLAVACWVMLLVNPLTLYDVGFQLSAAATLGLILLAPPMSAWLSARWPAMQGTLFHGEPVRLTDMGTLLRGVLVDGGVMTVAATALTLPLVAYHFQRVSLLGMLANLLIVPAQPLILVAGTLGLVIGLVGLLWPAQALLWVVWMGLSWTLVIVEWMARLPASSVPSGSYGVVALVATYALMALGYAAATSKRQFSLDALHPSRITSAAGLGTLALIAGLVWAANVTLPDGRLHVYFLDVGQGDGILIQTPTGRQVLIDGGANSVQLLSELGEVMPWWDRSIDMVLATHADLDHVGAHPVVLERYRVAYALTTPAMAADADAAAWRDAVTSGSTFGGPLLSIQHAGGWVDLGDGIALWVFWPRATPIGGDDVRNENSLVTKLVYGDFSVLLTGDAGIPSESSWLADHLPIASTVLKVGHHGSATSTSRGLVEAVNPTWAVIQVGADNTYAHPTQEVLDVLDGRTVLRNDLHGRIHFVSDGRQVSVETE